MSMKAEFIQNCEKFIKASGLTATEFGEKSCGDRNLMTRLRANRNVTMDKADQVVEYMKKHQKELKNENK